MSKIMKNFTVFLGVMGIFASSLHAAITTSIGFDDLADKSEGAVVPNGYRGLSWNGFLTMPPGSDWGPSGYHAGLISGLNVGFNAYGNPASIETVFLMTVSSGYFTAAWQDGLSLSVQAFRGNALVGSKEFVLSSTTPMLINLNFEYVTKITFSSGGGIKNPNYPIGGDQFVVDDLVITSVPEPSVLLCSVISLSLAVRRNRVPQLVGQVS